ncbi:hypothetical protein ACFLZ1_01365 [Patescibacteria group bacterium]
MGEKQPVQATSEPIPQPVNQETPVNIQPEPQKKSKKWLIFVLVLLFLSVSGVSGYFAYQYTLVNKQINTSILESIPTQKNQPTSEPSPTKAKQLESKGEPRLIRYGDQILFVDLVNQYFFDFSVIPEVSIGDGSEHWQIYDFDLYKLKEPHSSSVARFGISEQRVKSNDLTLEEFAKENYEYKPGPWETQGPWSKLIVSSIENKNIGNKYQSIAWTLQSETSQGYFFYDNLIDIGNDRVIYLRMVAWEKEVFDKNVVIFEKILSSFQIFEQ